MRFSSGMQLGHYEVVAPIGAGGMGEVYRALDTRLGREVAIKVLPQEFARDPERVARFEREARVLASLNHPNIAAIHGFEPSEGAPFLVLEYVPGETLRGPLPVEDAVAVASQIAEALEAAHDKGIIHRDLKPANVKTTPEGKVKVLDFGLAKAFADDAADGDPSRSPTMSILATRAGTLLGTAAYMSPEQARGKPLDKRSDIWAFGCVLYEMLAGKQTFSGESITDVLAAVVRAEPDWSALPASTPAGVRRLLERCLEKDPRRRLRDIGEARLLLESLDHEPAQSPPAPSTIHHPPSTKLAWGVAAALALLLAAVSVLHFRETAPQPEVVKLPLLPPEKNTFANFAVSPDGRRLAFTARDSSGKLQLWIRPMGSLTAQVVAGTERVFAPFWSPDSRFVGFYDNSKLKKVDVAGGPPQTLCDAPSMPGGGTWNRDGVIVFGNGTNGVLQRVAAAGGQPKPVTAFDQSRKETSHLWPHFLPDGRHFLYLARSSQREHTAVWAAALDSTDRKLVVAAESYTVYAGPPEGPGHLLFVREGSLMGQPFDPKKIETTGDPFPVAEAVGNSSTLPLASFTVSETGVLVYDSSNRGGELRPTWFDRSGKQLEAVGEPGNYITPALSPDGTRLAVDRYDSQNAGTGDIWLFDLTRGVSSRFTFDPRADRDPVWSPDGSRIVFRSDREGVFSLYQKIASGAGTDELLLKTGQYLAPSDWSQDGRFLVYHTNDPKTSSDLWILPLEGDRKPVPFLRTEFVEWNAQFSPDGRWIAYQSNESGQFQVYVQPYPATGAKWQISKGGGGVPKWRRDGKELFYLAADRQLTAVDVTLPRDAKGSLQAGIPKPLFASRGAGNQGRFAVSRDGQRFLMFARTEEDSGPSAATVVLNWNAAVRK